MNTKKQEFYKVLHKNPDGTLWSICKGFRRDKYFKLFGRQYWLDKQARMPRNRELYGLLVFDTLKCAQEYLRDARIVITSVIFKVTVGNKVWKPARTRWTLDWGAKEISRTNQAFWPEGTWMVNTLKLKEIVE